MRDDTDDPTQPSALERALARAADDERYRDEFYRVLLESEVYVIGTVPGGAGDRVLQPGEPISFAGSADPDGTRVIPFFSSLLALSRAINESRGYLRLPARNLFELSRGARLVLDPASDYGKEFLPAEVERLLEGLPPPTASIAPVTIQQNTEVLLGEPAEYPHELVRTLSRIFADVPQVRAAYLAQIVYSDHLEAPHLLIGLDAGAEFRAALAGLQPHAEALSAGPVIDLVPMGEPSPLVEHLAGTQPFYTRG